MIAVEINKSRQTLVWRPHLLTDVMESKSLKELALEPVLDRPDTKRARIEISSDEISLRWDWGIWNRVEISVANAKVSAFSLTYAKSESSEVDWQQLPAGRDVELTFHGSNGSIGRAKVQVPDTANFGRDVVFGSPSNGFVVLQVGKETSCSSVVAHWLQPDMENQYRPKGAPVVFPVGQLRATLAIPNNFFGILAVIAKQNNTRKLIAAADYKDNGSLVPHKSDNAHLRMLRRFLHDSGWTEFVETEKASIHDWLNSWPTDSQHRLGDIYNFALEHFATTEADDLLRHYPTGLLRYLALVRCGFKSSDAQRLIRQLNNVDFKTSLKFVLPALGGALEVLSSPVEREWAIQHSGHAGLHEAAAEAANHGTKALARALHLVEKRHEAIAAWQLRRNSPSL